MRAVLCNGFDGIKALTVGEAPEPQAAPDEVLIEVHAASVSYMDYLMICGGYQMRPTLPYVPGTLLVGMPVFVLTAHRTFSGAEEFTNDLKTQKRATIVGEVTGGGAQPGTWSVYVISFGGTTPAVAADDFTYG